MHVLQLGWVVDVWVGGISFSLHNSASLTLGKVPAACTGRITMFLSAPQSKRNHPSSEKQEKNQL